MRRSSTRPLRCRGAAARRRRTAPRGVSHRLRVGAPLAAPSARRRRPPAPPAIVAGAMAAVAARGGDRQPCAGGRGLYAAIGLPVNLRGLAIDDVRTTRRSSATRRCWWSKARSSTCAAGDRRAELADRVARRRRARALRLDDAPRPRSRLGAGERVAFRRAARGAAGRRRRRAGQIRRAGDKASLATRDEDHERRAASQGPVRRKGDRRANHGRWPRRSPPPSPRTCWSSRS